MVHALVHYRSRPGCYGGGIDLDPASCAAANETVKASQYYDEAANGLERPWYGKIWLNPPFGKTNNKSNIGIFVSKLLNEYGAGNVEQAVLLVHAKNTDAWFKPLWVFPICFADHHVKFHRPDGSMKDQMFGVCFVYLGPNESAFTSTFSQFGTVARRIAS